MALKTLPRLSRTLRFGILIAGIVGVITGAMAWQQAETERQANLEDIERRAHALAHQLSYSVREALELSDAAVLQVLGSRLEGYRRLIGFAVYRPDGRLIAAAKAVGEFTEAMQETVARALATKQEATDTLRTTGPPVHAYAVTIDGDTGTPIGALAVLHDLAFIEERATGRLVRSAFWILLATLLLLTIVVAMTWTTYDRPLHHLAQWMRRVRTEDASDAPPPRLPVELLGSESDRLAASFRAARSTGLLASRDVVHAERVWTADRLRSHALDCVGAGNQFVVVSNREPYMHQLRDGEPRVITPAGGLVTALDPVLKACGGLWVAHGAGDADRETSDERGRLTVPPGDSRYTLRRVWLSREEEQGYYYGFSNEGLWPLCHLAHERPIFRAADWRSYVKVNRRFADAVLEEIGSGGAVVLVQDYQLALLPQMLKEARPDLLVGLFWHIPWPNPESIRICPWRVEILRGMLGADLLGFHLQQYCNNFLDSVDRMLAARIDRNHFSVELDRQESLVRPFPISVQSWSERDVPTGEALENQIADWKGRLGLEGVEIAVGVDRIDYTKGLPERFRAIDRFLERHPRHRGRFTFVQLGAPSRTHIRRYREHIAELEALADEINWKYQTDDWKPIRFLISHHEPPTVHAFLRMARVCIVSSLHDGMNLVAKEYVAAQESGDGVLVLSEFAGAARELSDALIVNPYDTEQFADAIQRAVEMEADERRARMDRLRRTVEENNVYRWAANLLAELAAARAKQPYREPVLAASHSSSEPAR